MQSAYRSCHSIETALLRVYNDLLLAVDQGNEAVLILLDYSAAFDTISHNVFRNGSQLAKMKKSIPDMPLP